MVSADTTTGVQIAGVTLTTVGPVTGQVSLSINGGPGDAPYVSVRIAETLVYGYDLPAVGGFARAWARAKTMERLVPPTVSVPEVDLTQHVGALISARGGMAFECTGIASAASPNGRAHLVVRVGRVRWHVYDRAALNAHCGVWATAFDHARRLFAPENPEAFEDLVRREQRAQTPYYAGRG